MANQTEELRVLLGAALVLADKLGKYQTANAIQVASVMFEYERNHLRRIAGGQ